MQKQKAKTKKTVLGFEVTLEDLGKDTLHPSKLDTAELKLNIGCGSNKKSEFLGLDLIKTEATNVVADSTNLQIKDDCFDYVYSRRCIQHIKDDAQTLKEIYRVLKLYGKFELIVASFYGYLFYKLKLSKSRGRYSVFHLYLKRKLRKLVKEGGLINTNISKVKSVRKIGYDFRAICAEWKGDISNVLGFCDENLIPTTREHAFTFLYGGRILNVYEAAGFSGQRLFIN